MLLDTAIQATTAAEATLNADQASLLALQAAAASAAAPVPGAQAVVATDTTVFNDSLDALSAAALAAKIPVALVVTQVPEAA